MKNSIEQLRQALATLQFNETMEIVEALYDFTPTGFTNGDTRNEAGENNGSCKLFAFAKRN